MAERRTPSRIEDRIREVFMTKPHVRPTNDLSKEEIRSARLAEAMQRQLRPDTELKTRIQQLKREFERRVEQMEEDLRLKIATLKEELEAQIERETAEYERKGRTQTLSSSKPVRAFSTPRARDSEEEVKPKEPVKNALQKLQESKQKLAEYQSLLRTPAKSPQTTGNWTFISDSQPKTPHEDQQRPPKRPVPQSEGKRRADELPMRPKSLYERILALQKKP